MRLRLLTGILALLIALPPAARADDANEIDLKLFGEDVVEGWQGCRFALWQADRDPERDNFAYVLFAPIPDGEALPAWVKIGEDVISVAKQDIGSAETGMLEPVQLYKSTDSDLTVLLEIESQQRSDRGIEIEDARLTFLVNDKFPFPVRVKGLNGCLDDIGDAESLAVDAAPSGDGISLSQPVDIDSLDQVPAPILAAIAEQAPECEPQATAGYSTAYTVNDAVTLWQLPCNLYASRGSNVFVLRWTYQPDVATVLMIPPVPGSGEPETAELLEATVDPATATVTSVSLDRGGDCGTFAKFRLEDAPGETLEFTLLEHRSKTDCDGVQSDPADFPLVYESR
ncbi:MAG: DUF1176 domain-containing protein [Hoeflea sp.]|nr:DUF1176 domain-containing protein [Hoeflea sp.]